MTSAPTIAGTSIIVGSRIADNFAADMPGGVIRAYDVITGQLRSAFDPRNPIQTMSSNRVKSTNVVQLTLGLQCPMTHK